MRGAGGKVWATPSTGSAWKWQALFGCVCGCVCEWMWSTAASWTENRENNETVGIVLQLNWHIVRKRTAQTHTHTPNAFSWKINSFLRNSLDFFYCVANGPTGIFLLYRWLCLHSLGRRATRFRFGAWIFSVNAIWWAVLLDELTFSAAFGPKLRCLNTGSTYTATESESVKTYLFALVTGNSKNCVCHQHFGVSSPFVSFLLFFPILWPSKTEMDNPHRK